MRETQQEPKPKQSNPLQEGIDYYLEKGYWVFTEQYLRNRGYCCGNGCRHCPYGRTGPNKTSPQPPAQSR